MLEPIKPPQKPTVLTTPIQDTYTAPAVVEAPVMAYLEKPSPKKLVISASLFLLSIIMVALFPLVRGDGTVMRLNEAYVLNLTELIMVALGMFILTATLLTSYLTGIIQSKKAYTEEQIVYIRNRPKVLKWLVYAIIGSFVKIIFSIISIIANITFFDALNSVITLGVSISLVLFVVQAVRHLLSFMHEDVRFAAKHITKQAGIAAANKFVKK